MPLQSVYELNIAAPVNSAALPKIAEAKLTALRDEREELHSLYVVARQKQFQAREDLSILERNVAVGEAAQRTGTAVRQLPLPEGGNGYVVEPDPSLTTGTHLALARGRNELKRLSDIVADREHRWNEVAQLVLNLESFISRLPDEEQVAVAPAATFAPKKGETLQSSVESARQTIERGKRGLRSLLAAPLPSGEARQRAREAIDALADRGRPDLSLLIGHGGDIVFAKQQVPVAAFRQASSPSEFGNTIVFDALAFTAWLHRDALVARIDTEIKASADDAKAVKREDRSKKAQHLRSLLLAAEREEEGLVVYARGDGIIVPRRPDADPRAVLGIACELP